jgi:hypothetical protein
MGGMSPYLFAGIPVAELATALPWYEALFGQPATSFPNESEAVWELAEHRLVFVVQRPAHAGHATHALILESPGDLDAVVAAIALRGFEPAQREEYAGGVRKITYRDADGNEFAFGAVPGGTG